MSTVYDKTWDLFMAASLSDDDLGYPNEVTFVPDCPQWVDDVVWRSLTTGHATVLVGGEIELLLTPQQRSVIDRLRRRICVIVSPRVNGRASPFAVASRLGRHPVRQMRELAHA